MADVGRLCNFGCCMSCRAPLLPGDVMLVNRECVRVYLVNAQFFALQAENIPPSQFAGYIEMSHVIPHAQRHSAIRYAWSRVEQHVVNTGGFAPMPVLPGYDTLDDSNSVFFENSKNKKSEYRASWAPPASGIPLQRLLQRMCKLAGDREAPPTDLNLEYPCCSHCNDIMDASARIGWMCIEGLVPERAVVAYRRGGVVRHRPDRAANNFHTEELGGLVGYYLHRCLLNFNTVDCSGMRPSVRKVFVALCFVLLNIVAVWFERRSPITRKENPKGLHIYDGVLNLLTGHCLYLLFTLQGFARGVSFSRFHLLYMSELVDAPKEIWNQRMTALYAPLFDGADGGRGGANLERLLAGVADRLVDLYDFPVRYVCRRMLGLRPVRFFSEHADEWAAIVDFFLSRSEADLLEVRHDYCRVFSPTKKDQDISRYMRYVGVFPVLWPLLRSLVVEDERYRRLVFRWIAFERDGECEELVEHNQGIPILNRTYYGTRAREDNSLLIFNLLFLLRPQALFGAPVLEAVRRFAVPDIRRRARGQPFCSIWKATVRHAKLDCIGGPWFSRAVPVAARFCSDSLHFSSIARLVDSSATLRDSAPVESPPGSPSQRQGERQGSCVGQAPLQFVRCLWTQAASLD